MQFAANEATMKSPYTEAQDIAHARALAGTASPVRDAANDPDLPVYMNEVYDWAYVSPRNVRWLDRNIVVKTLLFGNDQRLMRAYLERIRPGMRVWQVAHVYGDLVRRAAKRVGPDGDFVLTDVTPVQLRHARKKLDDMPWAQTEWADAASFRAPGSCDLICSFFLLHEVPDAWKQRIVDNMLAQLPEDGEALFVDYHKPAWWHPLKPVLAVVNRLLEPFAHAVWKNELSYYATYPQDYTWEKRTVFGGVYQIVSVRRRKA
ncbi:MAG: rhodoquinone biosynthesis methyltransferase RquA [Moraxellaceae bacterium]|nr:rhodoquinone biosynthesis methyltransferase RquA [Moraxellaceae bacterium]